MKVIHQTTKERETIAYERELRIKAGFAVRKLHHQGKLKQNSLRAFLISKMEEIIEKSNLPIAGLK